MHKDSANEMLLHSVVNSFEQIMMTCKLKSTNAQMRIFLNHLLQIFFFQIYKNVIFTKHLSIEIERTSVYLSGNQAAIRRSDLRNDNASIEINIELIRLF